MRNFIFFILFATTSITTNLYGQSKTSISIIIHGYNEGWCKLIGIYGDQNYIVDSFAVQNNGLVTISRDSQLIQGFYYLLLPDFKNVSFLIDENQNFKAETNKDKLISSMNVQNSVANTLLYENFVIQEKIDSLQGSVKKDPSKKAEIQVKLDEWFRKRTQHLETCISKYPENFYTQFKVAGQNPTFSDVKKPNGDLDTFAHLQKYRNLFWSNVDFTNVKLLRTPVIANKLKRFIKELTPQHPDSIIRQSDVIIKKSLVNNEMFAFISNWIALQYQPTKTTVMDGEAVYVHIIDTYFDQHSADWFKPGEIEQLKKKTSEMRASLLNRKGPDVISTDPDGNKKSIYEIQSPYIIVYMYTPNCEHCKKETPKLKAFYNEWKNKGVEVFAIVIETNKEEWKSYLRSNEINDWVNVFDPTNASIYAKYYVDVTPEIYVLNPERIIIGKNLKVEQLPVIIQKDMKKSR
ncbi:MAG: TlpA family protein disulfide reductase [Saprospiraceae bacterium]|nr:TlpA family protein disulfide reductase [Saprospiraceae bacterium]MBK7525207.1 TlpA family protein disulfide reductase [Saprospiraceae bacterium]MBK9044215.1 TlpA family protein disulfide reductase [Saprospiraceae bacterium]